MLFNGWIKLHRRIRKHWIWDNPEYFRAWIDMLLIANHHEKKRLYKTELCTIKRGEFPTSLRKLSVRWGWSIGKIRRFILLLKNDRMIDTQTDTGFTLIKISNYDKYQLANDTPIDTLTDTVTDTVTDTQTDTTIRRLKNDKERKEEEGNFSLDYIKVWKLVYDHFGYQETQYSGFSHLIIEAIQRIGIESVFSCTNKFLKDEDSQIRSIRYFFEEGIDRYLVETEAKSKFKKMKSGLWRTYCLKCGKMNMPNDYQLKQNSSCCGVEYVPEKPKIVDTSDEDRIALERLGVTV